MRVGIDGDFKRKIINLPYLLVIISLAFMLTPLIIIIEDKGAIPAIKQNFKLWKQKWLQIFNFIVLAIGINFPAYLVAYVVQFIPPRMVFRFIGPPVAAFISVLIISALVTFYFSLPAIKEENYQPKS